MRQQLVRPAAVAGSWYPGNAAVLARQVDTLLAAVPPLPPPATEVVALVAPHAGLAYSGPVGAHAYRAVAGRALDVVVLAGPAHFHGFDGISIWNEGAFETPLGRIPVAEDAARAIEAASALIRPVPAAHTREHSLEMQLPFLHRVLPGVPIVPLLMGSQTRPAIDALAGSLVRGLRGRRALLVASTDLSHFFDAIRAAALDARVAGFIETFDPEGLLRELEQYPEHERGRFVACGGGPLVAVMQAARQLGAASGCVLHRADSSDVSGDKRAVVGYLSAVFSAPCT